MKLHETILNVETETLVKLYICDVKTQNWPQLQKSFDLNENWYNVFFWRIADTEFHFEIANSKIAPENR